MIDAERIDCDGRLLGRFAWPACQPEIATDFIKSALRDQGWTQQSQVAVLVDGAGDLRTVVELAIGLKPRTILDWFHISMRLRCIEQMAGALATRFPAGDFEEKLGLLSRVRWSMWNGQWVRAIERLRDAFRAGRASIAAASAADRQRIVRLNNRLLELRDYLRRNWSHLTNYGKAQRDGFRISPSTAESGMNHLVNKRMCKRQSMRWSRRVVRRRFEGAVRLVRRFIRLNPARSVLDRLDVHHLDPLHPGALLVGFHLIALAHLAHHQPALEQLRLAQRVDACR